MRILSSFRDYYDSVQAMGQDRSILYLREQKEEELGEESLEKYPFPSILGVNHHVNFFNGPTVWAQTIGFCGKIYGCARLACYNSGRYESSEAFCYNVDEVTEFIRANYKEKNFEGYMSKENTKDWTRNLRRQHFEEFFRLHEEQRDRHLEMFFSTKTPIIVGVRRIYSARLTHNAKLRDYEFMRQFDPYQAFQEIQMFMGSLAEDRKVVPVPSDEDMVSIKGFDKWSFRKEPTKKK